MSESAIPMNPAAVDPLPYFMPAPGATDGLFIFTLVFLIAAIFGAGLLYLRLHALPEQMAHGINKAQLTIIGVLALLALFTHQHIYWIAALLLSLIPFPDFSTPMNSMARSLAKLSGEEPPADEPTARHVEAAEARREAPVAPLERKA